MKRVAFACLVLVACKPSEKKSEVIDAAPVATATPEVEAEIDAAPAPTLALPPATAAPAKAPVAAKKPGVSAPAPEQCCCKVGKKHSFAGQSECVTTMKGACVPMAACEERSCCCKSSEMTVTRLMSACAEGKGTCVKKEQCQ
ncbi:MAG: hypothetical protein KIT84_02845 [Labilithrix sp.]|nr:hypothetical protein [Labilithrix sp.]MCW5809919.1 hypothetical protein [Labilithrix sp.]